MKFKTITYLLLFFICFGGKIKAQGVANYINNGGFELNYSCSFPNYLSKAKYWMPIDSISYGGGYYSYCNSSIPYPNGGFQYPRTGNALILSGFFCEPSVCINPNRGYLKNRMKGNLINGKTYCVKFYVNIANPSPYGIEGFAAYFGNGLIDTITKCTIPLTYITPQIQCQTIITDTLNWTLVTGTFVANGTEKYCVIGNFKSDLATNAVTINPAYLPQQWTDVLIYDVSCIPIDVPASAGPDFWAIPGNTVYIGRPQDVGIDEACTWYNLTNTTTSVANAAGFSLTVSAVTATYMVKQDICGVIKYDTVVVHASALGNVEWQMLNDKLKIYPNPVEGMLNVELKILNGKDAYSFAIYNSLGQIIRVEELSFKNNIAEINTKDLENGVYVLSLFDGSTSLTRGTPPSSATRSDRILVSKRFVISR